MFLLGGGESGCVVLSAVFVKHLHELNRVHVLKVYILLLLLHERPARPNDDVHIEHIGLSGVYFSFNLHYNRYISMLYKSRTAAVVQIQFSLLVSL